MAMSIGAKRVCGGHPDLQLLVQEGGRTPLVYGEERIPLGKTTTR